MKVKTARNIHLFLLAFLGLSAIGGGGALIISPSGKLLGGLPLSLLQNSPFDNFLIPGIILFVVLGLFPTVLIFVLRKKTASPFSEHFNFFKDMHWPWSFSIYVGFALIIWLQTEMYFLQGVGWLHNFYMIVAIAIIFVSLLPQVRAVYKK
jgi:hypothetical protein